MQIKTTITHDQTLRVALFSVPPYLVCKFSVYLISKKEYIESTKAIKEHKKRR
jgi:hypothetical protein